MFEPNRFVRVRYTKSGERRVLYGFCPLHNKTPDIVGWSLSTLEQQGAADVVVEDVSVVKMSCSAGRGDTILEKVNDYEYQG